MLYDADNNPIHDKHGNPPVDEPEPLRVTEWFSQNPQAVVRRGELLQVLNHLERGRARKAEQLRRQNSLIGRLLRLLFKARR